MTVTFNFAGSNTLAQQITQGAPADVFASADTQNMDKVTSGLVDDPQTFAHNKLRDRPGQATPARSRR